MSDRREKIAKALHEFDVHLREADGDFGVKTAPWDETDDYTRTMFREYADAALTAIDAAPTEAEIGAACPECGGHGRDCSFCGGTGDWPRTSEPTADEIIAAADAIEEICPSLRDAYPDGPSYTAPVVLAKAALIAARKARHE